MVERLRRRVGGVAVGITAIAVAAVIGLVGVAPVRSQLPVLEAAHTSATVPVDDAWAPVWVDAPLLDVALSAQDISFPFGGGTVDTVRVRSLFDDERIYISMEWSDAGADDAVNGAEEYSDAAAVQFPAEHRATPPWTMGSERHAVNIWQWKAVWQSDIEQGFSTSADRYPNTFVDGYPNAGDPLFNPAAHVGNPVAQRSHVSPIENIIARGFGTVTTADVQDVTGSAEWREGRWRLVFSRALTPPAEGLAVFQPNTTTLAAFAVWDGASGDRNGQKSVAQFIELDIGPVERLGSPGAAARGSHGEVIGLLLVSAAALLGTVLLARRSSRTDPAAGSDHP